MFKAFLLKLKRGKQEDQKDHSAIVNRYEFKRPKLKIWSQIILFTLQRLLDFDFFSSIRRYFWMPPVDFWLHILLYLFTFVLNDRLRSSSPSISKITQEILREGSRHYELSTCSEKKIHTIIANSSPLKFQYTYSHNTVMAIGPKSLWGRIANFTFTVVISKRMFSQNWSVRS